MAAGRVSGKVQRRWQVAPLQGEARELGASLKISPLIAQVLLRRKVSDPEECRRFLQPSLKLLHAPELMPGVPAAAERLARAIREREPIVIYGDYDVDGITGVAILWQAIRLLGGDVSFYLPHRLEEGYGLNSEAILSLALAGAKVIVTVDCGVTAVAPAAAAKAAGVDLIITDHHEWVRGGDLAQLPAAFAIVHPRLPGAYPNGHLCGAGVAFKLAWALGQCMAGGARVGDAFREFLVDATSLAALGTIADVVPLQGENRVLAHFGLLHLPKSRLTGIRALLEASALVGKKVDAYDVGFRLAPRLNACGRMGHAGKAVEMFTTATPDQAFEIARELEAHNRERQALERRILDEALQQVAQLGLGSEGHSAIVVGSEGWHPGVVGIVASRLVDRFYRPAVVVAFEQSEGHGSGRSVAGYHLADAFARMGGILEKSGGHEMAAGLRVHAGRFEAFREAFLADAQASIDKALLQPVLELDATATLSEITLGLVQDLEKLAPFGQANAAPVFHCPQLELASEPLRVGQTGDHLQMRVRQGERVMKCIAFGMGEWAARLRQGMMIDVAAEPSLNHYNGVTSVQLEVKDMRLAQTRHAGQEAAAAAAQ
jgi:single-stranded-DNA-specific exonuclease